jgi:transcriptional regulator with XRE-family HTH domain
MNSTSFGELHKHLREERQLTLRKYCLSIGQDPGNISRIERGISLPPQNEETLKTMASTLGLKENSKSWKDFFDRAAIGAGRLPKEILSNEELLNNLPILLRTLTGRKVTEEKIDELIHLIKKG